AQIKAYNDRDQLSIDGAIAATAGITADEAASAALIKQLQDSQGNVWTAEDQAALDELQNLSKAKTEKLESATAALAALDSTLPPPIPPVIVDPNTPPPAVP